MRGRPRIKGRFVRLTPAGAEPAAAGVQGPDPSPDEEAADAAGASDCAHKDSEG